MRPKKGGRYGRAITARLWGQRFVGANGAVFGYARTFGRHSQSFLPCDLHRHSQTSEILRNLHTSLTNFSEILRNLSEFVDRNLRNPRKSSIAIAFAIFSNLWPQPSSDHTAKTEQTSNKSFPDLPVVVVCAV